MSCRAMQTLIDITAQCLQCLMHSDTEFCWSISAYDEHHISTATFVGISCRHKIGHGPRRSPSENSIDKETIALNKMLLIDVLKLVAATRSRIDILSIWMV